MALPVSYYGQTLGDNTKKNGEENVPETATWVLPVTTVTAANQVAVAALLVTLSSAINAINDGVVQKTETTLSRVMAAGGRAASTESQREKKYLIRYHDVTTLKKFRVTIPCADLSLLADGAEFLDMAGAEGAALKTAFEAVVVSPDDSSHAVILDSIQYVGRNS